MTLLQQIDMYHSSFGTPIIMNDKCARRLKTTSPDTWYTGLQ